MANKTILKAQGKEVGAKPWIVKPFQPSKLLEVVSGLGPS
jgi:hypothetical protein